jgi:hypothetical protein
MIKKIQQLFDPLEDQRTVRIGPHEAQQLVKTQQFRRASAARLCQDVEQFGFITVRILVELLFDSFEGGQD